MSQDSLTFSSFNCALTKWLRFLRYNLRHKCSPWFTLAIAPFKVIFASGVQRTDIKIRCMRAMSKINFVGVYKLLNDLLW